MNKFVNDPTKYGSYQLYLEAYKEYLEEWFSLNVTDHVPNRLSDDELNSMTKESVVFLIKQLYIATDRIFDGAKKMQKIAIHGVDQMVKSDSRIVKNRKIIEYLLSKQYRDPSCIKTIRKIQKSSHDESDFLLDGAVGFVAGAAIDSLVSD